MCTVTFYKNPITQKIFITSNRDEHYTRGESLAIQAYSKNGKKLYYPKDSDKGGTWFVTDGCTKGIVLLNGGIVKHEQKDSYRKSRGEIVLELAYEKDSLKKLKNIDLEDIEPFTLVLFQENRLFHFYWDGTNKNTKELSIDEPHIWSSSTLYTSEIQKGKRRNFINFIEKTKNIDEEACYSFNLSEEKSGDIHTVSVSQLIVNKDIISFSHKYIADLKANV